MFRREPRTPSEAAFEMVSGFLLVGCLALNAGLLFLMCFVPDGCGSSHNRDALVCRGGGYLEVLAAPWISLALASAAVGLGGLLARRRRRSPWPALLLGAVLHGAGLAFVRLGIRG
ncbi:hypothetical protein [Streptomyces sp. NRRL B-24484]|uniref:hypothetical protein n=1 Tax=Streptomyces sp. NRRL B-24484 TaxID=1463833 RepID=UPI0004C0D260|nr:hypothetical protein [Streptomyces sp. NRRL B-24484]